MKKIMFSIMALVAISTEAIAQNALTVGEIQLPQKDEATLTVNFQFDAANAYTAYQFNLELPSDLEFVMKEGTEAVYVKGDCYNDGHSITANLNEGLLKVVCLSTDDQPLKGTSGILLQFTIRPKTNDLTIGQEYTGTIKDIVLSPVEGAKQKLDDSNFTVTITQYTILDETSTIAPTAKSNVDVLVRRTIKANEWSTICLPFAMTAEQVKTAFGDKVKLGDFTGYDITEESDIITGIAVHFNTVTNIVANHPYVIWVSSAITEFTVDGVTIDPDDAIVSFGYYTGKKPQVYHPKDFVGTYVADFDFYNAANSYPLFLSGNKFYYATEHTKHMKAFRAFFDFDDVLSEVANASTRIGFNFDETTGIKEVHGNANVEGTYDLQGRKVEEPVKGVYIVNGKKVVKK